MIFHQTHVEVPATVLGILQYGLIVAASLAFELIILWAMGTIVLMISAFGLAHIWAGVSGDHSVIRAWPKAVSNTSVKLARQGLKWLAHGLRLGTVWIVTTLVAWLRRAIPHLWRATCAFARACFARVDAWLTSFSNWLRA
jgi:hypothetical protein